MPALIAGIYGFIAACMSLVGETLFLVLFPSLQVYALLPIVGASALEELAKIAFLLQFGRRYPSTGITFPIALSLGLGFALAEMALILGTGTPLLIAPTAWIMLVGIGLLHVLTPLLFTLILKKFGSTPFSIVLGWLFMTLLHILYNLLALG